jgi:1-acyl-sn-glycerol-3-phosphate acyltransferase
VVVCNHQSDLDPMVHLRTLPLSLRVLAMRELFRIPLFGAAMRTIGMIEVDRASPDFGQIDRTATRDLVAGHSLLAFPEGRISPDGTIDAFKDGAFVIAVASQVPVVPVAIDGTRRIWPPGNARSTAANLGSPMGGILGQLMNPKIYRLRGQSRIIECDGSVLADLAEQEGVLVAGAVMDPDRRHYQPQPSFGGWLQPRAGTQGHHPARHRLRHPVLLPEPRPQTQSTGAPGRNNRAPAGPVSYGLAA